MRNYLSIFVIFIIFFGLFSNHIFAASQQLAPDFRLHSLKNDAVRLSSFRDNKPVLLLFWTTWCSYCRDQLVWLKDRYPAYAKDGLELLTINVGESEEKIEKFAKLRNLSLPFLMDYDSSVANSFGVMGVPTYVLIDRSGYIVFIDNSFPEREIRSILSK